MASPQLQITSPKDRLSNLPGELLELIFEQVQLEEEARKYDDFCEDRQAAAHMAPSIAKIFHPYLQKVHYQSVFITTGETFSRLKRSIDSDPQRGLLVKSLNLSGFEWAPSSSREAVRQLIRALPTLSHLYLGGGDLAAEAFDCLCDEAFSVNNFTRLKELDVDDCDERSEHPYDYRTYLPLNCLSNLEELAITAHDYDPYHDIEAISLADLDGSSGVLKHIKKLVFRGSRSWSDGVPRDLLGRLPALTSLNVAYSGQNNLLENLSKASKSLTELDLTQFGCSTTEDDLVHEAIHLFPHLLRLRIAYRSVTPELLTSIALHTSIQTLQLSEWDNSSIHSLHPLLIGNTRMQQLQHLILGNNWISQGVHGHSFSDPTCEHFCPFDTPINDDFAKLNGWTLPQWTKNESCAKQSRALKTLQKLTKVAITGTLLDAIKVEEKYFAEFRKWDVGRMLSEIERWHEDA